MNMPSTHNAPHMKKAGAAAALVVTLSLAGIPAALATNESSDSVPSVTAATKATGGSAGPGSHAAGSAAAVASQKHETATYEKTEVIYGTLAANGKMETARVVNKFAVASGGGIVDYGMYSAVRTMTQDTDLFSAKGSTSFTANKGTFYYQGEAPHLELPWKYNVTYTLKGTNSRGEQVDGWEVSAAELAGATGTVGIHLTSSENPQANPDYYKSYMTQITFTLNTSCSDVKAEGATMAAAGENQTVAFTVLPGRNADCTLTMQAENFSMPAAQIAALPYKSVIEMPDTSSTASQMQYLSDAVGQLTNGTTQLSHGATQLKAGAWDLAEGVSAFGDGLDSLNANSAGLVGGSSQISDALNMLAQAANNPELIGQIKELDKLGAVKETLLQLADTFDAIAGELEGIDGSLDTEIDKIGVSVNSLVPEGLTEQSINDLETAAMQSAPAANGAAGNAGAATAGANASAAGAADANGAAAQAGEAQAAAPQAAGPKVISPENAKTIQNLRTLLANANTLKGSFAELKTQQKELDEGNKSLAQKLRDQSKQLREMADMLPENVTASELYAQFSGGMTELSTQYSQFHEGLKLYTNGVEALAANHNSVENGAYEYANGIESFAQGAKELDGGMNVLNEATITLPMEMQRQIDGMMAEYTFPEFVPQSYMSADNKHTEAVQFVITTPAIEQPKAEAAPEAPEAEPTVWDRFLSLFK